MAIDTVKGFGAQHGADRRMVLVGVLLSTITLAYFYLVDNFYLSTRYMTPIFQYLLLVDDSRTAWLTLGISAAAAYWKNAAPFLRLADFLGAHAVAVAGGVVALIGLGALFVYHNNPLCMDEYAAVFQAKIFAAGRLTTQLPPAVINWLIPPGFNGAFLVASRITGQAIEAYWPGFALILAPFEYFDVPWLCNASLAGLSILLIHRITLEITADTRAAGWAVGFAICSGAFVANAISYYSMQAHLTANLLFVWLLLKPTPYRAFAAGVVGSLALVLHNPFPHTMFAVPWIIAIARSKEPRQTFFPLVLGYIPLTLFVGAGWLHIREVVTAGDSGFNVISNNINAVFSLPDKPMIDMRAAALVKMWIWAVPGLFLLALLGRLRCGADQRVRLLAQSALVTFVGYIFVIFDQGHGWGYRYFHSAWGVIPILAGCAMVGRAGTNDRLAAFAGAAAVLNLLLVVPYQLMQVDAVITRHSQQLPTPQRPGNNVYFVHDLGGFYLADLVQADPLLRAADLVLYSAGPQTDAELRRQNWPLAVLVRRSFGIEEWNLGPMDQRRTSTDLPGVRRFVLSFSNDGLLGDSSSLTQREH